MHNERCMGCKRAKGKEPVVGGIIDLGEHWMANHLSPEANPFLGWLVMQPKQHGDWLSDFKDNKELLQGLGLKMQQLECALRLTWDELYPDNKIKRVYIVQFSESVYAEKNPEHIHFHVIPRAEKMVCKAWHIPCYGEKKPERTDIELFMKKLKENLEKEC